MGRFQSVAAIRDSSSMASCYAESNGRVRPRADLPMNYERAKQMNDELVANIVSFEEDDAVAVLAFCAEEERSL
jgi:hypothetical protein